jgi:hypothetical protein
MRAVVDCQPGQSRSVGHGKRVRGEDTFRSSARVKSYLEVQPESTRAKVGVGEAVQGLQAQLYVRLRIAQRALRWWTRPLMSMRNVGRKRAGKGRIGYAFKHAEIRRDELRYTAGVGSKLHILCRTSPSRDQRKLIRRMIRSIGRQTQSNAVGLLEKTGSMYPPRGFTRTATRTRNSKYSATPYKSTILCDRSALCLSESWWLFCFHSHRFHHRSP